MYTVAYWNEIESAARVGRTADFAEANRWASQSVDLIGIFDNIVIIRDDGTHVFTRSQGRPTDLTWERDTRILPINILG